MWKTNHKNFIERFFIKLRNSLFQYSWKLHDADLHTTPLSCLVQRPVQRSLTRCVSENFIGLIIRVYVMLCLCIHAIGKHFLREKARTFHYWPGIGGINQSLGSNPEANSVFYQRPAHPSINSYLPAPDSL